MGWLEFTLSALVFLATHSLPLRPAIRHPIERQIGAPLFLSLYSALSLGALGWLIVAAGRAPFLALWDWAPWQALVPQIGMALVCFIAALAIGRPNPFSFGGAREAAFDPANPGIIGWMHHPLLVAMAIWAGAHVVPNGDLAHVLMFGAFAIFALSGIAIIDRRRRRIMGGAWVALRAQTKRWPRPHITPDGVKRLALGTLVYALLVWLHPWLFGVYPFG